MNVREAANVRNRLTTWYVESETTPGTEYIIHNKRNTVSHRKTWACNCLDFTERQVYVGGICKHIQAVQNFRNLQIAKEAADKALTVGVREAISTLMATFAGKEGLSLWHLVSFLRGPDTPFSSTLKQKTTAVLRAKLGLRKGLVDTNFIDEPFGIEILRRFRNIEDNRWEFTNSLKDALRGEFGEDSREIVTEHFAHHYAEALMTAYKLGYIK